MDFHSALADAEIKGNNLVCFALGHKVENFALPWGEVAHALDNGVPLTQPFPIFLVRLARLVDAID